jgi:exonuclease SbcC
MRPLRLVVEGFSAFRNRAELDFEGADLFALVGPTGSGKSSVIDAMTFALYGRVARYDDARLVAPVITQGAVTAKVDLRFTLGDESYRAYREVTRRGTGASTKEARLEHGGEILAGDATEMTREVESLLGLSFDQFTRCVALPQGEFARFLHDKPKDRRALLVQLLDLGLYGRMAARANELAKASSAQMELLDTQLAELSATEPVDEAGLEQLVQRLADLADKLRAEQPRIDHLESEMRAAEERATVAARGVSKLAGVEVPEEVRQHLDLDAGAAKAVTEAEKAEIAAEVTLASAENQRAALPERSLLDAQRELYADRASLDERITSGESLTSEAEQGAVETALAVDGAELDLRTAADALLSARTEHAAHGLAADLEPGDPCPVCHQTVDEIPQHDLSDIRALDKAHSRAEKEVSKARTRKDKAVRQHEKYAQQLAALAERAGELDQRLAGAPPLDELGPLEVEVGEAENAVAGARTMLDAARDQRKSAEKKRRKIEMLVRADRDDLAELREQLADLEPPKAKRDDLIAAWESLAAWADGQRPVLEKEAAESRARADELGTQRVALADEMVKACLDAGLEVGDRDRFEVVDGSRRDVQRRLDQARERRERAAKLVEQRAETAADQQVSHALGRYLRSDGFQQWLLDEAVEVLVAGATERLRTLSSGQYSLTVDAKDEFLVIDHFNTDEARLARTLSGGETFLASLALALALSDQIADLAAEGAPRLESIFLDEGFGTLDPETLDVVVDAIESLHATGRMVGLVSHVPELAARVPVRFVVRKDGTTATVERAES